MKPGIWGVDPEGSVRYENFTFKNDHVLKIIETLSVTSENVLLAAARTCGVRVRHFDVTKPYFNSYNGEDMKIYL